jgi:hypothetical protein
MTRSRAASVALALALSVALAGTAFAKGPHAKNAKHSRPDRGAVVKVLDATAAPSLKATANAAQLGGFLRLNAVLHAPRADRPATCLADVHFASGDVLDVVLTRSGGGSSYHAAVPVLATETPGPVLFDVECLVGTATLTATGAGKVQPGGEGTEAAEAPEAPESPDAGDANVVVPDLGGLSQAERQALFDQLVALLAKLLGVSPSGSTA